MADLAKIAFIADQYGACLWYRCLLPARALHRLGHTVVVQDAAELVRKYDVLVFQRPYFPATLQSIREAREAGRTVVVDMDDDLWHIHPSNPAHEVWRNPRRIGTLEESLRAADVVTVPTAQLAELTSRFNRNVVILPNMLASQDWPPSIPRRLDTERVVVGWAGSPWRAHDLKMLSGVLEKLLATYEKLDVRIAGLTELPFKKHERLTLVEPVSLEDYPLLLERFDIGLAPVVDSRFNGCKSDLKFLEYGMVGLPVVASNAVTYTRSIKHGKNGFLASNAKDWIKYVSRLIEQPELRRTIGEEARRFAETRLIEDNIHLWLEAYGLEP